MLVVFFIDFISLGLLTAALYLLLKEKIFSESLNPFRPAIAFLIVSRIFDMLTEHPDIHLSEYFHVASGSLETVVATAGNVCDTISFILLIYGFLKIAKYKQAKEKEIQALQQMLPLCASCKKYRTEDGRWLPIEQYLIDFGAPPVSHSICPECSQRLYGDILNKK